jgi:hypothetical protein
VPKGKKDIVIFEGSASGLGVRKTNSGAVSFLIQIRLSDKSGRRWRETLGRWPTLSIADARAALQVRVGDIARGFDPFEEREAAAAEREAKREREAAEKAKAEADEFKLRHLMRKWDRIGLANRRRSYAVAALRAIELTFPALLNLPVSAIDRKTVRLAVNEAEATRGTAAAIMAASAMRTMFRWAAKNDLVNTDIMLNFAMPEGGPARDATRCASSAGRKSSRTRSRARSSFSRPSGRSRAALAAGTASTCRPLRSL